MATFSQVLQMVAQDGGLAGEVQGVEADPGIFNMVFARSGAFLYLPAPDGTVWWSARVNSPERPRLDGVGDAEWLEQLGELYRFEKVPRALLRATTRLHRPTLTHTLADVPTRHDDHTVLIGDAATRWARVRARRWRSRTPWCSPGNWPWPVRSRPRWPATTGPAARVAKITKVDGGNRATKTAGPVGRRLQDVMMPVGIRLFYDRATAWLYDHDLGELPVPVGR